MAIQIGGILMPASMNKRAISYSFEPTAIQVRNGLGEVQTAGGATVLWTWATLNHDEFSFLITTLLDGKPSKRFAGAPGSTVLYNDVWAEQPFSHCVVLRPKYKGYSGIAYLEVQLQIDSLY